MNQMSPQAWQTSKRVLVIDNHAIVRRGVRAMVESKPYWEVVGEADCGVDAIELAEQLRPHIVVMDLSLPRLSGLDTMAELRLRLPNLAVIILTIYHSDSSLRQALDGGALGYVCKNESEHRAGCSRVTSRRRGTRRPRRRRSSATSHPSDHH